MFLFVQLTVHPDTWPRAALCIFERLGRVAGDAMSIAVRIAPMREVRLFMLGGEMTKRDWKRRSAERKRTTLHTLCECIYPVTATCRFLHVKRLKLLRPSQVVQTVKNTILILSGCSDWQKNTIFILSGCSERLFPSSWECR